MLQFDINQAADYTGCSTNTVRNHFIKNQDEINIALGYTAVQLIREGNTRKYYIAKDAIDYIIALTKREKHLPLTKEKERQPNVVNELVAMVQYERRKYEELENQYRILYKTLKNERKHHQEFAESMAKRKRM